MLRVGPRQQLRTMLACCHYPGIPRVPLPPLINLLPISTSLKFLWYDKSNVDFEGTVVSITLLTTSACRNIFWCRFVFEYRANILCLQNEQVCFRAYKHVLDGLNRFCMDDPNLCCKKWGSRGRGYLRKGKGILGKGIFEERMN